MIRIADTGLIVAFLSRRDRWYPWALAQFREHAPYFVCDAVLSEAASFFPNPLGILKLLERGDLVLDTAFVLSLELSQVTSLAEKYADRPMDLADACIVRVSELHDRCKVWTVDRADFQTYRRNSRQSVPCEFPPDR